LKGVSAVFRSYWTRSKGGIHSIAKQTLDSFATAYTVAHTKDVPAYAAVPPLTTRRRVLEGHTQADSRQQTADSRRQTADRRQQTADSRQQTADGRQQTADGRQQTADSRQ
jgi:hypothetical protein